MNTIELLIEEKIAKNQFQANHIANGLRLWQCDTDEEKLKRARLYRDWRNSQFFKKSDTKSCYEKAILGEEVPQEALIPEALHTKELVDHPLETGD